MNVKVRYGIENLDKFFPGETISVREVISNGTVKASLGYGDNVRALLDGVEVGPETILSNGDEITLETRANSKAVELSGPLDKQKLHPIRAQLNCALLCVNNAISAL